MKGARCKLLVLAGVDCCMSVARHARVTRGDRCVDRSAVTKRCRSRGDIPRCGVAAHRGDWGLGRRNIQGEADPRGTPAEALSRAGVLEQDFGKVGGGGRARSHLNPGLQQGALDSMTPTSRGQRYWAATSAFGSAGNTSSTARFWIVRWRHGQESDAATRVRGLWRASSKRARQVADLRHAPRMAQGV